jgi:PKHD-type hydroxylase
MKSKDIDIITPIYLTPTGLSEGVINALLTDTEDWDGELLTSQVIKESEGKQTRKSKQLWLNTDHWVAGMMAHFVLQANREFFKYDLEGWAERIQYTVYGEKGSFYGWHVDTALSSFNSELLRKLSISLILSDPDEYEGGEIQFHRLYNLETHKPPRGTAIIFSSQTPHRVRPVKSGVRKSLVGWFGGPKWK